MKFTKEAQEIIPQKKAKESQQAVKQMLEDRGFVVAEVNHPNTNGIDIIAIKNGVAFTFEVKSAISGTRSWKVNKVTVKSDYIAIVLPNRLIHIDSMEDHLKLCGKDGSRAITSIVKLHGLLEKTD